MSSEEIYKDKDLRNDSKKCRNPTKLGPTEVMNFWFESEAYYKLLKFVIALNDSVRRNPMKPKVPSKSIEGLKNFIKKIETISNNTPLQPAVDGSFRFGNLAFRDFLNNLEHQSTELITELLSYNQMNYHPNFVLELSGYFGDMFGSKQRIDYGTGHELHFLAFLCCLYAFNFFTQEDFKDLVYEVIYNYMRLIRSVMDRYNLEPAGNQGFLLPDEYQFIGFIFGSAEMVMQSSITPTDTVPFNRQGADYEGYIALNADNSFWMETIQYIISRKSGPFAEHSKMLWNVSATPSWSKINTGMLKMYKQEVLAKQPMVQHFLFGSILDYTPVKS